MNPITVIAIESWTMYSIGVSLIIARLISRMLSNGKPGIFGTLNWGQLGIDDYLMCCVLVTYTILQYAINQVIVFGSNYFGPTIDISHLTTTMIHNAVLGSKWTLIMEEMMLATQWLIKACFLLLYNKITLGLPQHFWVKLVAGYTVFGFVLGQVLFLAVWCRPFNGYWAVPVKDPQCATYDNHMITATVFNASSDLMILAIPLPLVLKARFPLKKKVLLSCVFSLGLLVILCCALNRYYNFSKPYSSLFLNWYVAESSTAVYVSNVILIYPLLARLFGIRPYGQSDNSSNPGNVMRTACGIYDGKLSDDNTRSNTYTSNSELPDSDETASKEYMMNRWGGNVTEPAWETEESLELQSHKRASWVKTTSEVTVGTGVEFIEKCKDVGDEPLCTINRASSIMKTTQVKQEITVVGSEESAKMESQRTEQGYIQ